jgi:hypothetical protein
MSAYSPSMDIGHHLPQGGSPNPGRRSVPKPGDVLASERTARADVYAISIVPAAAHVVVRRYPEAIERVRELARQLRVDGWYTCDQTHYAAVAQHRAPRAG